MTKKSVLIRVDCEFVENIKKLYPKTTTTPERTRRLNILLEELLYGKKTK